MSKTVEQVVGDAVVSGSGFCDFAAASGRLNLVSTFHYSSLATEEEIRRAFPTPEQQPSVLAIHVGRGPGDYADILDAFCSACPEWKSQYVPACRVRRINPPGTWDLWMIRRGVKQPSLQKLLRDRREDWPQILGPGPGG